MVYIVSSTSPIRFGIYLPGELAEELEKIMRERGIRNRSRIVQEAIRMFVNEHKWRKHGRVCGVIGVVYNHEVSGVDEKLTDIQHEFLDTIVSTLHVHLDREKCLLAIVVRGESDRVKKLIGLLEGIKGVLLTRTMLLEAV